MVDNRFRQPAPLEHADEAVHRTLIAQRANVGLPLDGTHPMQQPLVLDSNTVATVPDATLWEGGIIYIPDESGGSIPAFSDGTNWRRFTDRAIIS